MNPVPATVAAVLSAPPALVRSVDGPPPGWSSYRVQRGDTLYTIAQRTGTTPDALVAQNRLPAGGHYIWTGSTLLVPASGAAAAAPAPGPAAAGPAPGGAPAAAGKPALVSSTAYLVKPGDTLWGIARLSNASEISLVKANGLAAPYLLQVGRVLQVPQLAPTAPVPTFAGRTYPQATLDAAAANRAALAKARVPNRTTTRGIIAGTAQRNAVDPKLAMAVGYQESGWNQRQVSIANAVGTMQVIPSAGEWASQLAGRQLDLLDTHDNITAGVLILRALSRSATSAEEAIAGYYQGLSSVRAKGIYPDTVGYVSAIKALQARM